jgi:L-alanine-DL-glutamate epimerase-like enolase superfamily enzyme
MADVPALTWEKLTLKLRNPFHVSYGVSETRQAFWVRLPGDEGWGEGTIPPYYRIDHSAMTECWQRAATQNKPLPEDVDEVADWIPQGPAPARSAIELALYDRLAKKRNVPLHALLGLPKPRDLATSFTISIDTPDAMAAMAKQIADYPIIKVKLGSDDDDESRLRAVREARPDAMIRVDANAGWMLGQAVANVAWLERYNIEMIEQPLPIGDARALGELQRRTAIPVVADESVQTIKDVEDLGAAGVRGINVKLMKVGGLTPALRCIHRARELGMGVMLGCMIETSIGTTAMAHLAGMADWLDLDAPILISNDPFQGVTYDKHARMTMPDRPGIGVVRSAGGSS